MSCRNHSQVIHSIHRPSAERPTISSGEAKNFVEGRHRETGELKKIFKIQRRVSKSEVVYTF